MGGWDKSINNTKIGQRQAKEGSFTELKASTDPVDEHGVGDKGFNDGLYMPKDLDVTTVIQPAGNAAVSTAIVDTYGGVVITLTGAGNAQTLQTPTDATVIKRFIVVVKGAFNIQINGITMTGGEAQWFIWDSASWVAITAIDADDITATPHGDIVATNVQGYLDELENEKLAKLKATFTAATELTIVAGVITITQSVHRVDTQSDDASDELDTINGGADGDLLILRAEHTDRTVVLKDSTGNLDLWTGDIDLDEIDKYLILTYDGTLSKWFIAGGAGLNVVNDAVYGAGWNGVTKRSPSKNAVYDKIDAMDTAIGLNTAKTGVTSEISNIVDDTTPQLGGDLDCNSHAISSPTNPVDENGVGDRGYYSGLVASNGVECIVYT